MLTEREINECYDAARISWQLVEEKIVDELAVRPNSSTHLKGEIIAFLLTQLLNEPPLNLDGEWQKTLIEIEVAFDQLTKPDPFYGPSQYTKAHKRDFERSELLHNKLRDEYISWYVNRKRSTEDWAWKQAFDEERLDMVLSVREMELDRIAKGIRVDVDKIWSRNSRISIGTHYASFFRIGEENSSFSVSFRQWAEILHLAVKHGWHPQRIDPVDTKDTSVFRNWSRELVEAYGEDEFEIYHDEALEISDALEKAMSSIPGKDQWEDYGLAFPDPVSPEGYFSGPHGKLFVKKVSTYCSNGGFEKL